MPPRPRTPSGGDTPHDPGGGSRPHGGTPGGGGVHSNEAAAMAKAHQGRATAASTPSDIARGQPDHLFTRATGTPGGAPTGTPLRVSRRVPADDTNDNRRSIDRENDAAVVMADKGYFVHQKPTKPEVAGAREATGDTGDPLKDPDYLVEGRVFDCYAPKAAKSPYGIWSVAKGKIVDLQTQRVVLNLKDWSGDIRDLQQQFTDWPIEGIKEVKAILPSGEVVQISLPRTNG